MERERERKKGREGEISFIKHEEQMKCYQGRERERE